ncbi:MAG: hypothetical protein ACTSWX_06180 [Promethearchaeota archaeon]
MNNTLIAIFEILIAVGLIGFWIYFFLIENKNPEKSDVYFGFERSFPIPDLGWATPSLIIAAIGLLLEQRFGIFFTITSGSALLFLGLLDISFNARNGGYTTNIGDTIMNIFINLVCVIFGPLFMIFAWGLF